jgi:hypothetical protein
MKTKTKPLAYADTMRQAEARWGIPKAEIIRGKSAGCLAFRGPRIYRDELVLWIAANPRPAGTSDGDGLRAQKLRAQISILEIQIAKERGDLCERALVQEFAGALVSDIFEIVARHVPDPATFNAISRELKVKIAARGEVTRAHL